MTSKFASILELSRLLHSQTNAEFSETLKRLVDINQRYKSAIISAIFRNFFQDSPINDRLLADSLRISRELLQDTTSTTNLQQSSINHFESLADSLLCKIASYLPTKDVFSKWNRVNHKFIQIGLKPESITSIVVLFRWKFFSAHKALFFCNIQFCNIGIFVI